MRQYKEELKQRTKQLGLRVIDMTEALPHGLTADVIAKQIVRSATSVGANYRAACRARSIAEVIAKLSIVLEEADETMYWMEMLIDARIVPESKLDSLMIEANEIVSILVTSLKSLKYRQSRYVRGSKKTSAETI